MKGYFLPKLRAQPFFQPCPLTLPASSLPPYSADYPSEYNVVEKQKILRCFHCYQEGQVCCIFFDLDRISRKSGIGQKFHNIIFGPVKKLPVCEILDPYLERVSFGRVCEEEGTVAVQETL